MIELTLDQRQAIAAHQENPPRAMDPDTKQLYVLIPEEVYLRVQTVFSPEEDDEVLRAAYPHVMEVFGREGWDDPVMDVYNDLDPRGSP